MLFRSLQIYHHFLMLYKSNTEKQQNICQYKDIVLLQHVLILSIGILINPSHYYQNPFQILFCYSNVVIPESTKIMGWIRITKESTKKILVVVVSLQCHKWNSPLEMCLLFRNNNNTKYLIFFFIIGNKNMWKETIQRIWLNDPVYNPQDYLYCTLVLHSLCYFTISLCASRLFTECY
jgi:hypothetical protein